jgi:hypothetical protein
VQFAWELEGALGQPLAPVEFTAVANEHIYLMMFLLDYELFHRQGPAHRSRTVDRVVYCLNTLMQDEHLASYSSYQAKVQVAPRIWQSGYASDLQNDRSAGYSRFTRDKLDWRAIVHEFARWIEVALPGRPQHVPFTVADRRVASDFAQVVRCLDGAATPEHN